MPISFEKAQQKLINTNFLDNNADEKSIYIILEESLNQYAELFLTNLAAEINAKKISASGNLLDKTRFEIVDNNGNGVIFKILMVDYYDYVNKGVRGVKSSTNAPQSPYQFKNFRMSDEGRRSLRTWMLSGKMKVRNVVKTKSIGYERKNKKISRETDLENLIYNIKKYGIKKRGYFDEAIRKTFGDFTQSITEVVGKTVAISIGEFSKQINK